MFNDGLRRERSVHLEGTTPATAASAAQALALAVLLLATASTATAQTSFSIDHRSPTKGTPDCGGLPITEGDILVPATGFPVPGPVGAPCVLIPAPGLGLAPAAYAACLGLAAPMPCGLEVDALSYGMDGPSMPGLPPGSFWFSVDPFAGGFLSPAPPNVFSEGIVGVGEASADVFIDFGGGLPTPVCPGAAPTMVTGAFDGNGLAGPSAFAYPGLGLVEPNAPLICPPGAYLGDNLDAVDVDGLALGGGMIFYSLDAAFLDPICGVPWTGSAAAAGVLPGAVLLSVGGAAPAIYAPPAALGLDLAGVATDDIDALAIFENGVAGYAPSMIPDDWLGGGTDMVLFSVREGSAVIGALDSICGAAIAAGDILTTPLPPAMGGLSPFPGIYVSAETLGLLTPRTHLVVLGDELDALDVTRMPVFDCDGNGLEDAADIAMGACDTNGNGIPEACECGVLGNYCTGKTTSQGCIPFVDSVGTPSVSSTLAFNIRGEDFTPGNGGILIYGYKKANLDFHGGKLCVKTPIRTAGKIAKTKAAIACTTATSTGRLTTNFNNRIQGGLDPLLTCGQKVFVQWQQRDPANTIGGFGDALSDGMRFIICP